MMRVNLFNRYRSALKLTVAVTCLGMLAASSASAETFKASTSKQLEEAVTKADANGVANTIELAAGAYLPAKSLVFTNTGGRQTVTGPAGTIGVATPGVQLNGGSVTPVAGVSERELFLVNEGVTVTLEHVVVTSGGEAGGTPGIEDRGTLNVEDATISGNLGTQIFVESGATANLTNSTLSDGHEFGLVDEGAASFLNVTIVHNASGGVGGTGSGTVSLTNTIVGLNGAPQCGSNTITSDHSLTPTQAAAAKQNCRTRHRCCSRRCSMMVVPRRSIPRRPAVRRSMPVTRQSVPQRTSAVIRVLPLAALVATSALTSTARRRLRSWCPRK